MPLDFGRFAFGGVVVLVVAAALSRFDERLAWLFVAIVLLTVITVNRVAFFGALNYLAGLLRSVK